MCKCLYFDAGEIRKFNFVNTCRKPQLNGFHKLHDTEECIFFL